MGPEIVANGTLASVGAATKAFVVTHPIGIAVAGGALLGITSYYMLGKVFKKKTTIPAQQETPVTA
jgi:hypothetical protein